MQYAAWDFDCWPCVTWLYMCLLFTPSASFHFYCFLFHAVWNAHKTSGIGNNNNDTARTAEWACSSLIWFATYATKYCPLPIILQRLAERYYSWATLPLWIAKGTCVSCFLLLMQCYNAISHLYTHYSPRMMSASFVCACVFFRCRVYHSMVDKCLSRTNV